MAPKSEKLNVSWKRYTTQRIDEMDKRFIPLENFERNNKNI